MDVYVLYSDVYGFHREVFVSWDAMSRARETVNALYGGDYTDVSYYPVPLVLNEKVI